MKRTTLLLTSALCAVGGVAWSVAGRHPDPPVAAPAASASAKAPNDHAWIPPQCYTRTRDDAGRVHNPCFTCHTQARGPDFIDDRDLQLGYDFPEAARVNHWRNLFAPPGGTGSDQEVLGYARASNRPLRGAPPPASWDVDGNGVFDGYVPDAAFQFDEEGFDRDGAGVPTGWRAFAYYPFPGTFWPTNGSAGDVLIRLSAPYREREDGTPDLDVYRLNLAIAEALMNERDVPVPPTDEARWGVDLDRDGRLGRATQVTFRFAPLRGHTLEWVGRARALAREGKAPLAAGLLPLGTELLHTVRYLDVQGGEVTLGARLKELRYAKKTRYLGYADLEQRTSRENREAHNYPDRLREVFPDPERGVANGMGWVYQGLIEDAGGALRPQSKAELTFCVGCHGGIGATRDGVFSFARKLPPSAFRAGWFHWSDRGLRGLPEPRRRDGQWEYTLYLEQNGAADELRANAEARARFFRSDGALDAEAVARLHEDIATLLLPSPARAIALDRAYRAIVLSQSFDLGRDALLAPAVSVHEHVPEGERTGVREPVRASWLPAGD